MSSSGLQLRPASLGPSANQRTPLAHRFHLPLQGKLPPSQVQSRQQIQCKFKRDEHQEGDSIFPQAQVLNKTALRKYPKAKLEEELRIRDLDASGNKQELVERLHAALTVFLGEERTIPEAPSSSASRDNVPHLLGSETATFELQSDTVSVSVETDNSLATLLDFTKKELQQALVERGLPKTGNKTDLAQRLFAALEDERSVLLTEQMEASAELQRQYQEAAASSGFRLPGVTDSTGADDEEEDFSMWATQLESEEGNYGMPGEDAERGPNMESRPSAEKDLPDRDWRMMNNRPSEMMEMFEHQGTAAAELASEDYAQHQRAERTNAVAFNNDEDEEARVEDSQDIDDDMNPSVTGSRSGRQQRMSPFGEDPDRFDTDNELEDGFSFVSEDADGFDSDAEERLVQLDSSGAQGRERQLESAHTSEDPFSQRHRNYQNLSARSPDFEDEALDEDEDVRDEEQLGPLEEPTAQGLLDTVVAGEKLEGTLVGTGRGAAAVSGATADGKAAFLGRATPQYSVPPITGSTVSIPGGGVKGKGAGQRQGKTALTHAAGQESAVVASQGVSSLDTTTALEWMLTRLPEAAQLPSTGSSTPQPGSSAVEDQLGAPEQDTGADQAVEDGAEAVDLEQAVAPVDLPLADQAEEGGPEALDVEQAVAAAEAPAAALEQLPEDLAMLETEAPVQLQGFELATEEAATSPAQLHALSDEAVEGMQAPNDDVDEQAKDHYESRDTINGSAEALAAEDMAADTVQMQTGQLQAQPESEKGELSSELDESAAAPTAEEAALLSAAVADGAAEAEETSPMAETAAEVLPSAHEADALETVEAVPVTEIQPVKPDQTTDVDESVVETIGSSAGQLPQQAEVAALQEEMKQRQEAITALQSKMEAASTAGDDNTARIASLQAALVELQSQQLAWKHDNLSGRLAKLLDAAPKATLNASAKDELKGQLEAMRGELTQLEADLASRNSEAADLSRALAEERAKLSGGSGTAPAGHNRVPGSIQVKLDMDLGQLTGTGPEVPAQSGGKRLPFPSSKAAAAQSRASRPQARKSSFDAGSALSAGLVGAVKLVSSLFGLGGKPSRGKQEQKKRSTQGQSSGQKPTAQDETDS